MTLWDRVERWRSEAKDDGKFGYHFRRACLQHAESLEADLRELMVVVERVPHKQEYKAIPEPTPKYLKDWPKICLPDCPRCALEARIGAVK